MNKNLLILFRGISAALDEFIAATAPEPEPKKQLSDDPADKDCPVGYP